MPIVERANFSRNWLRKLESGGTFLVRARNKIMKISTAKPADYIRQSLNLILAPAMWILSSIGFISEAARTASEFSDMSDNLLVPLGPAFSIWFPIFVGCIAYGLIQALPRNRTQSLFRETGWWTAFGFACVCGWALITAYMPGRWVQWSSALIFIPAVTALIIATLTVRRQKQALRGIETWLVWLPISLIAGWCSLAIFLNWTPIAYDLFAKGQANILSSLLMLAAALGLIIWAFKQSGFNRAYIFPALWGLSWLAARHLGQSADTPLIGWAAVVGIVLLIVTAICGRQKA